MTDSEQIAALVKGMEVLIARIRSELSDSEADMILSGIHTGEWPPDAEAATWTA